MQLVWRLCHKHSSDQNPHSLLSCSCGDAGMRAGLVLGSGLDLGFSSSLSGCPGWWQGSWGQGLPSATTPCSQPCRPFLFCAFSTPNIHFSNSRGWSWTRPRAFFRCHFHPGWSQPHPDKQELKPGHWHKSGYFGGSKCVAAALGGGCQDWHLLPSFTQHEEIPSPKNQQEHPSWKREEQPGMTKREMQLE